MCTLVGGEVVPCGNPHCPMKGENGSINLEKVTEVVQIRNDALELSLAYLAALQKKHGTKEDDEQ